MSTKACIYYDLETITEKDVKGIVEKYNGLHTVHLHKESNSWPNVQGITVDTIESERSVEYRNDLMKRMDMLFEEIRSYGKFNDVLTMRGVDLLEIARFDLFFPFSYSVYQIWMLERLIDRFSPDTLVWVSSPNQVNNFLNIKVTEYLEQMGITLIKLPIEQAPAIDNQKFTKMLFWRIAMGDIKRSLFEVLHSMIHKPYHKSEKVPNNVDILFLENFPNSAKISVAIARELEKNKNVNYFFGATNQSVIKICGDLDNKLLIKELLKTKDWINIAYKKLRVTYLANKIVNKIKSGQYKNWWGAGELTDPSVSLGISKALRHATELIINNNILLRMLNPRVVATTNASNSFSRAIVALGNKQSTETFLIQHGYPNFDDFENHLLHKKVLVWGKSGINDWVRFGVKPENIIITGSPKFERDDTISTDTLHSQKQPIKVTYFPSLVGGSSMSEEISVRALDMVLKTFKDKKDVRLTIKTKIQDKFTIINKFKNFNNINIIKERDAVDVINESDIVIVTTSNVGLEACVIGKPLIVLMLSGIRERLFSFYEKFGCALFATTDEELQNAVEKIIYNKKIRYRLLKGRGFFVNDVFNGCKPGVVKRMAATLIMSG